MAVAAVSPDLVDQLRSAFLAEVADKGQDAVNPKDYERVKADNHWLQRFLAHNDCNVSQTLKMMWTSLTWRKEFKVNGTVSNAWFVSTEINEDNIRMDLIIKGAFFPHGKDIDGKQMLVFKCKMHTKGSVDMDEVKRCVVYWFERVERMTKGDIISIFFDMEGCGLGNMDMELIKYLIGLFKEYYPFFLNYIIIYEMAWILSAAFKIVKTWLPEKAIEKLKTVSKKDVQNFVPKSEALQSWGGDSNYVFTFVPEKGPPEPAEPKNSGRKVHFVVGNSMPDQAPHSDHEEDGPLKVNPDGIITFAREGRDLVSSLELHNTDASTQITFKLKTTSPEKFRVKPSTGCLKPGGKETVTVTVMPGYQLGAMSKDKFLLMSTALEEKQAEGLDLTEFWKVCTKTECGPNCHCLFNLQDFSHDSSGRKVYRNRLRCVQSGEVTRNGNVWLKTEASEPKLDKLTAALSQIGDIQAKLNRFQYILVGQSVLILVLALVLLYALRAVPSEIDYCMNPSRPDQ
ncbi:hypothetical protein HUJ04_008524 [Dendroctonus ponderosae]|nr:hypothetical protein HUJ04_008524 [Dendroctonus ponderosae]